VVEQVPHLGLGGLLQGADLSPSGTVHQDIEAAMALYRLVDNRDVPGGVSDVQRDGNELIGGELS
jgi:hypothetical protein